MGPTIAQLLSDSSPQVLLFRGVRRIRPAKHPVSHLLARQARSRSSYLTQCNDNDVIGRYERCPRCTATTTLLSPEYHPSRRSLMSITRSTANSNLWLRSWCVWPRRLCCRSLQGCIVCRFIRLQLTKNSLEFVEGECKYKFITERQLCDLLYSTTIASFF